MLAQLERVEVEARRRRDHELAVEHDLVGQLREQRLAQLGEVAQQRLLVAALEIELVAVAEHDATEPVPLRLVRRGRPRCGMSRVSFASIGSNGGRREGPSLEAMPRPDGHRGTPRRWRARSVLVLGNFPGGVRTRFERLHIPRTYLALGVAYVLVRIYVVRGNGDRGLVPRHADLPARRDGSGLSRS